MSDQPAELDGDLYVVSVAVERGQASELLSRREFDFGDHPNIEPDADGRAARLTMFVSKLQIETLRDEGFIVVPGVNMSARGRERLGEVGQGDRFEGGLTAPKGIGRKIGCDVGGKPS